MPRRPRWLNCVYAFVFRYFWLPCPRCGRMFGGHESSRHGSVPTGQPGAARITCWRCP